MPPARSPAWDHVEWADDYTPTNPKWVCDYCKKTYTGNATRIEAHLAGHACKGIEPCSKVPAAVLAKIRSDLQKREEKKHRSKSLSQLDAATSGCPGSAGSAPTPGAASRTSTLYSFWATGHKEEVCFLPVSSLS